MTRYSTFYHSSRAVIFTFFLAIWFGFFYWLAKYFLYRYVLMDDYYQVEKPREPGSVQYVIEPAYVIGQPRQPLVVALRYPNIVRFADLYEEFFLDYLPFLGMAILNIVLFRSWVFNAVEVYLILVPVWLFNVLKIVPPRFFLLSLITKFWWMGWMLGFFINIWTIKTY